MNKGCKAKIGARVLFLALFFFAVSARAASPDDPAWRALLHFSGSSSSVEAASPFFLSPHGSSEPAAEWVATRKLFANDPDSVCRYPARALYFGLNPLRGHGPFCERWFAWRDALRATGIELVFASSYINSPSSMYGHTLLKFPRGGITEGDELLDYTLSYGADTAGTGAIAYVVKGLAGGFDGKYVTAPFYVKVREYNHVENRDFWIYPLKVKPAELDLLVAHAWELRDVAFPYYFLRKNCSFFLLEFLEVARPGEGLNDAFPLWAIPVDTIRRLRSFGWVGEPRQRPSRRKKLQAYADSFSEGERQLARALSQGTEIPKTGVSARVLDAAYELWRFRTEGDTPKPKEDLISRNLLRARGAAQADDRPAPKPAPEPDPEEGHLSSRASLGGGADRLHAFGELQYRSALHDILGNSTGYEPTSELSMGDFRFRWEDKKFFLEQFDLLRIRSLAPSNEWFTGTAWSFRAGARRNEELNCAAWHCLGGLIQGGVGKAASISANGNLFALVEADLEAGAPFQSHYRIALGPTVGIFLPLWSSARFLVEGEWRFHLAGEKIQRHLGRLTLSQDLGRNWEIRGGAEVDRAYGEWSLHAGHYF